MQITLSNIKLSLFPIDILFKITQISITNQLIIKLRFLLLEVASNSKDKSFNNPTGSEGAHKKETILKSKKGQTQRVMCVRRFDIFMYFF